MPSILVVMFICLGFSQPPVSIYPTWSIGVLVMALVTVLVNIYFSWSSHGLASGHPICPNLAMLCCYFLDLVSHDSSHTSGLISGHYLFSLASSRSGLGVVSHLITIWPLFIQPSRPHF